jgi:hypothetical protein
LANDFRQSLFLLRRAGGSITTVDISETLKKLEAANDLITTYECARFHGPRLKVFGNQLTQPLADFVRDGLKIPTERYYDAVRYVFDSRVRIAEMFKSTPAILTPAATGPAHLGLFTAQDPVMSAPWTALGIPTISIPMPIASGLLLGSPMTADLVQD